MSRQRFPVEASCPRGGACAPSTHREMGLLPWPGSQGGGGNSPCLRWGSGVGIGQGRNPFPGAMLSPLLSSPVFRGCFFAGNASFCLDDSGKMGDRGVLSPGPPRNPGRRFCLPGWAPAAVLLVLGTDGGVKSTFPLENGGFAGRGVIPCPLGGGVGAMLPHDVVSPFSSFP